MSIHIDNSEYKILVVDDVPSNITLLTILLKHEKFSVISANGGLDALRKVESEKPDLILLDIMMPDLDGYEVVAKIREMDFPMNDTPVIFLSALNASSEIVKGFKYGGNDFISKPFSKEELMIRVNHQISLIAAKKTILRQTESLKKTMKSRDRMYSVIAHDLRSPLGSIKMMLNILFVSLDEGKIGKDMYEMLSLSNQTTEETFNLLDNLLKWTKSQINKLNVVYQDLNLYEELKGIVSFSDNIAQPKGISVVMGNEKECGAFGDKDMIATITRNLLSNAIKFSYKGGVITVNYEDGKDENEGFAVVSVADQGCGMDESAQSSLLQDGSTFTTYGTANEEGSGLGLILCRDFATKMGGKLWLKSKKGVGTTFYFTIPKDDTKKNNLEIKDDKIS